MLLRSSAEHSAKSVATPSFAPARARVPCAELHSELVLARILVAHQLRGAGVEILLGVAHALAERRRHGLVQDLHAATRAHR